MLGLRIRSCSRLFANNGFLLALAVFFAYLGTVDVRLFVFLVFFLFYLLIRSPRLFIAAFVLSLLLILHVLFLRGYLAPCEMSKATGKIIQVSEQNGSSRLLIAISPARYVLARTSETCFRAGWKVAVQGVWREWSGEVVPLGFDQASYYQSQRIISEIDEATVRVLTRGYSLARWRTSVLQTIEADYNKESAALMSALLFGDKSLMDEMTLKSFSTNGVTHLFAVSGLHVDFMVSGIEALSGKFHLPEKATRWFIGAFLVVYVVLTAGSPSIVRASLMYFGRRTNERASLEFSSLDNISFVFVLMMVLNPVNGRLPGFALSFISVFALALSSGLFERFSPLARALAQSVLITILTLPYIISFTHEVNLLTPFWNIIFIALVTSIVFPLTTLAFILPFLGGLYGIMASGFLLLSRFCAECAISLPVAVLSSGECIAFYASLFLLAFGLSLEKKLYRTLSVLLSALSLIAILTLTPYDRDEIVFLDVYQGDATFISLDGTKLLIDTGSGKNDVVLDYLSARGVTKLDALVITHPDNDHNGEAASILSSIKVKTLALNPYDETDYGATNTNIARLAAGDEFKVGPLELKVIAPIGIGDTNEESLVFTLELRGIKFLFTGDSPKEVLEVVGPAAGDVDVLKVGHHGSVTGTSIAFLEEVKPEIAIIMAGHVERFGFPSASVIAMLEHEGITIYRTDQDTSIMMNLATGEISRLKYLEKERGLW